MKTAYLCIKIFLCAFIFLLTAIKGNTQTVDLKLSGIKNKDGVIQLTIYNNPESYKKEIPEIYLEFKKDSVQNGCLTLNINNLTPGTWGIAAIDDENSNGKLDYRFYVPKEGFGFSNYKFKKHCKPDFNEFSFTLENETKEVIIDMFYF